MSVVLPVHGGAPYLRSSVESVLRQTYTNFELLIVLDRASEAVFKLAHELGAGDSRVRVVESPMAGLSNALNYGISVSTGELIARIDDDDEMLPMRLEKQVTVLERKAKTCCVGSQVTYFGDASRRVTSSLPIFAWQVKLENQVSNPIAHPSLLIRKKSIIEAGWYDSRFLMAEDYELLGRLLSQGHVRNTPQPLTKYRLHERQMSAKRSAFDPYVLSVLERSNIGTKPQDSGWPEVYLSGKDPQRLFLERMSSNSRLALGVLGVQSALLSTSGKNSMLGIVSAARFAPFLLVKLGLSKFVTFVVKIWTLSEQRFTRALERFRRK